MCQGIFSSTSKVKHPFSTRSELRHELVALQTEQRDECQTHTGLRGLQQLTSAIGLWPDFWKRPHSSWKQPQLIYCGTIQLPCIYHQCACECVQVFPKIMHRYESYWRTTGHESQHKLWFKVSGTHGNPKGLLVQFCVLWGIFIKPIMTNTDIWVKNSTLTSGWVYLWSPVVRKKTHPVLCWYLVIYLFLRYGFCWAACSCCMHKNMETHLKFTAKCFWMYYVHWKLGRQ